MKPNPSFTQSPDVILVGGGVMSGTLAILLNELQPDLTLALFESLDGIAAESSNAWNNAGTGHAALCELNYTPSNRTAPSKFPRRSASTKHSNCRGNSGPTSSSVA